ncbi:MAG: short-chain dehydrogenase/reductase [Bacteroidetes bacterium]|jgi:NAD(P)-dependent dehydrogenase (short-subunit alcohol dehydrogenase family)|nr:short-chain dehydrogenase/reductase [Bacteroidota bacterium]
MDLKGKIIVVTGGLGLLGKAYVAHLTEKGATAICADINCKDDLAANQLYLDITNEKGVKDVVAKLVETYGKIDGWINNAYPRTADWGKWIDELPFESWRKNIDMHLNGYFLCCQNVLEQMKKQQSGSFINMASIYGIVGPDFTVYEGTQMGNAVGYAAIKGGLINLTRYLASYYGKFNVRVNCISPGGIFDNQPEPFLSNYNKKVPLKRMGTPADIAPSVSFLMSDEAAYITGHNLVIDGGWTAI